jgi:hypothetical protein
MTRTRMLLLLAAAVVLGADAIALLEAAYNRSGAPVETIELTERELRLERPLPESTALFLRLTWKPERGRSDDPRSRTRRSGSTAPSSNTSATIAACR